MQTPKQRPQEYLALEDDSFIGISWQPRRLLDTYQVGFLQQMCADIVYPLRNVDFSDLPATLPWAKLQRDVWLSYERLKRVRMRDHVTFLFEVSFILSTQRQIKEELRRIL